MYAKYVMNDHKDYRGNVKLVVRNANGEDVAYTNVDDVGEDMIELVEEEIGLVKENTDAAWWTERGNMRQKIDITADKVRSSYLYPGPRSLDIEYAQVEKVIEQWEDAGKPQNQEDVPDEIWVWKEVTGLSLNEAADDIKLATSEHRQAVRLIRRIRLIAKRDISECDGCDLHGIFNKAIDDLMALMANPRVEEF